MTIQLFIYLSFLHNLDTIKPYPKRDSLKPHHPRVSFPTYCPDCLSKRILHIHCREKRQKTYDSDDLNERLDVNAAEMASQLEDPSTTALSVYTIKSLL